MAGRKREDARSFRGMFGGEKTLWPNIALNTRYYSCQRGRMREGIWRTDMPHEWQILEVRKKYEKCDNPRFTPWSSEGVSE